MLVYLLIINAIAVLIFAIDKASSRKQGQRVPEKLLHLLELAGGVFGISATMFIIRHKNKKRSYFLRTFLILTLWCVLLFCLYFDKN